MNDQSTVTGVFRPTHVVPPHGMPAWQTPDPDRPTLPLDPLLPVQLVELRGDWGHVLCANGWSAWVDARHLVAVPQDPPLPTGDPAPAEDAGALLARAEHALAEYRAAVRELAGGLDAESFRRRTRGVRIGVVVDGESVWLYDQGRGRWVYARGNRLSTYAADGSPEHVSSENTPSEHPPPAYPPTRVVTPDER